MDISITDFLTDWMALFLKNKDLIFKRFSSITVDKNKLTLVQHNGTVQVFYVKPFPQDLVKELQDIKAHSTTSFGIVVANTKRNFEALIHHWDALVNMHKQLCIYFVNPFSGRAKQWAIHPATHQLITGGSGLKLGLTALFDTVEETTEDELTKNIKEHALSEAYPLHISTASAKKEDDS
ncbi:MAG: hypothetical protein Q7R76_05025 [Candidatus Woesearchaeota archaeon]|nr:hypothetical protein [Candidatus Woesearchaeota archaeon]